MHFRKALLATAVFAFMSVSAAPSALGDNISANTLGHQLVKKDVQNAAALELDGRSYDGIDDTAAQIARLFFGDVLPAADWKTVCDGIAQSMREHRDGHHPDHDHHSRQVNLPAIFVAGGLLTFGGELSDFARRIIFLTLQISAMLANSGIH